MGSCLYYQAGENERHGTSLGNYWVRSVTSWNKDAFHISYKIQKY